MVSRQERDARRRREEKSRARLVRSARVRRERQVVALVLVVLLVAITAAVGSILGGRSASPDAGTDASTSPSVPASDEPSASAAPAPSEAAPSTDENGDPLPLPTTQPRQFSAPPPAIDALATTWTVTLETNLGPVVLELDGAAAPQAVSSFLMLARDGFYDGTACHRLLPESLLQCGDPTATGTGGPGYSFGPLENVPDDGLYPAGTVAMARTADDAESQGSQFFLVFSDVPLPDDAAGGYTVFGTVVQGLDILRSVGAAGTDQRAQDERPATGVIIEEAVIS